jgi:hypothetical protein
LARRTCAPTGTTAAVGIVRVHELVVVNGGIRHERRAVRPATNDLRGELPRGRIGVRLRSRAFGDRAPEQIDILFELSKNQIGAVPSEAHHVVDPGQPAKPG